jgi:hypothetical protein
VADAAARPGTVLPGHDGVDNDVSRRFSDFRGRRGRRGTRRRLAGTGSHLPKRARKLHRCQTASKSARERGIRGLVWPLQQRCKCGTSGGTRRIPHKILHFGRRRTAKAKPGAAEATAVASLRPQRAGALAFFAKKSDCRGRAVGRRSNAARHGWSQLLPPRAATHSSACACCSRATAQTLRALAGGWSRGRGGRRRTHTATLAVRPLRGGTCGGLAAPSREPPRGGRRDRRSARRLT